MPDPTFRDRKVFTTGQIAKICNVAPRTVSKWHDSGRLKGYRIPGSNDRRVPRASLLAFLAEHGMPTDLLPDVFRLLLIGPSAGVLRDALREHEAAQEWTIEVALSGFAAGRAVAQAPPDVVVIDLALGRGDGLAIARAIQLDERCAIKGPALIAIANEDETDLAGLSAAGIGEVYQRPYDPALLMAALERIEGART